MSYFVSYRFEFSRCNVFEYECDTGRFSGRSIAILAIVQLLPPEATWVQVSVEVTELYFGPVAAARGGNSREMHMQGGRNPNI